ncbi:intracellular protein transport protein USO1-like [Nicotiana sylvestris]|uniref:intracellular protein transport protein USO1-like n=1 Tax=Nicotiana sylvestris TaxID=4096 RepID=UPI00388CE50E
MSPVGAQFNSSESKEQLREQVTTSSRLCVVSVRTNREPGSLYSLVDPKILSIGIRAGFFYLAKQSKIDMLTTEYELFRMKNDESIQDMNTRFTSIINELHSFGEIISRNKLVNKILSVLPSSWESKKKKKKKDNERREPKREKNLVFKTDNNDSSGEDDDVAYLTRRFQKMDCPILKQDQYKNNSNKAAKRNPVPDKLFKRKNVADNVVRQALVAWGDSSSESEEENVHRDSSMMVVESEAIEYDSIFALMAQSDYDEDNDDEKTIENLKKEKDALDEKIANIEHEIDDLMIVVVDLKETIECVRKEKEVLTERVTNIEHDRDDLLVVVVDLKETIGELK